MITQHYSFRCDVPGCTREDIDTITTPMDWETAGTGPITAPPRPLLPAGWTRVNDEIICPNHRVTIEPVDA